MGRTKYILMTGDVNGDGQNDVLLKAVPSIVMIPLDDDLIFPFPVAAPSPTFALISNSYGKYTLVIKPDAETLSAVAWQPGSQQVIFSGADVNFAGSVQIKAISGEQASFVISMGSTTGELQITSTTAPAIDMSVVTPAPPSQSPPAAPVCNP